MSLDDLTGKKFGKLTVLKRSEKRSKSGTLWDCVCSCGKEVTVFSSNLKRGTSTSCGCNKKINPNSKKHGMSDSRIYRIWSLMKSRCNNKNSRAYPRYGGRGIKVCDEWNEPSNFFNWAMENGYREDLTIDRIDNNGDYCPENCRWVSMKEQENNTSRNIFFSMDGETKSLTQWCDCFNMPYAAVRKRIKTLGWDFRKAIETPIDNKYHHKSSKR